MAKKTTLKEFEAVFPKLEEALLEDTKRFNLPEEQLAWYKAVSVRRRIGSSLHGGLMPIDS